MDSRDEKIMAVEAEIKSADAPKQEIATPEAQPQSEVVGEEGAPVGAAKPAELTDLQKAEHAFRRKTNKLTRRVGERDMRIAELEEKLRQLEPGSGQQPAIQEPVKAPEKGRPLRPKLEDYDFDQSAHDAALEEYEDQVFHWRREQEKVKETVQQRQKRFAEQESAFVADHPDYMEVTRDPNVPITEMVAAALMETENPPAVAYYLAQNLEEANAIARMTPIAAARAIGRIEAKLVEPPQQQNTLPSPPTKTVTKAPPPVTMVSPGATGKTNLTSWSVDDHIEAVRANRNR